jgi:DNA-binding CsgD family transcriptional regulator
MNWVQSMLQIKGADDDLPVAVYEESPDLKLDVQLAVEALSPQDRAICAALSQGHSIAQIARDLGCDRYIVRCAVRDIRSRFQAIGLEGWLSH